VCSMQRVAKLMWPAWHWPHLVYVHFIFHFWLHHLFDEIMKSFVLFRGLGDWKKNVA
jgi:hypothetical protein